MSNIKFRQNVIKAFVIIAIWVNIWNACIIMKAARCAISIEIFKMRNKNDPISCHFCFCFYWDFVAIYYSKVIVWAF